MNRAKFYIKLIFISLLVFYLGGIATFAKGDEIVRGVMDIHSNISDGQSSLERITGLAKEKGISVLVFGDSALRKWEYGIWPLRNLIKKTYQENSVLRFGAEKYVKKLITLEKESSGLVLIPGVEVSPFFYWEGSPFSKNLALIDYYKQFLVIGLKPNDYQNLPIVGNRRFFFLSRNMLFALWPMLIIVFGLGLLRKKILGISLIVIGVLFLVNNLPFSTSRFNVYQGYQGVKPYQGLIDYVYKKGGLIFWAHPEMLSQKRYFGIETYTLTHPEDLLLTHDYTGFGVTSGAKLTEIGNIWDKMLLEYIEGKRKNPVWIIGAVHYTREQGKIDNPETLFFIKEARQEDVLDALRQGRMYVRFKLGEEPMVLREFKAKNIGSGSIQIIIKGNSSSTLKPVKIELIRNGKVFKSFEETRSEWLIAVEDNLSAKEKTAYYRLKISSDSCLILSNPVFTENIGGFLQSIQ